MVWGLGVDGKTFMQAILVILLGVAQPHVPKIRRQILCLSHQCVLIRDVDRNTPGIGRLDRLK